MWRGQADQQRRLDKTLDGLGVPSARDRRGASRRCATWSNATASACRRVDFFACAPTGLATPRAAPRLRAAEEPAGRAQPAGERRVRACLQRLEQPGRLPLGQAAPDRVRRHRRRRPVHDPERDNWASRRRSPGLRGLAVDGGFGVVDASSHSARADRPTRSCSAAARIAATSACRAPRRARSMRETALPGGMSGVLSSPFYANLLENSGK